MAEKTVIYIKQNGWPRIPLTVRIEWLPDGTIIPRSYWTPDGSCYDVKHVYETVHLAFLKDKGEGIRFKVRAEAAETPEPYADNPFTQHETYLYLADNWFCGKNMIDGRYGHEGKEFIPVTLDVFPNCDYELVYFEFQGIRYEVEKTVAIEPRGSFHAGGVGIWHKVRARQANSDDERMAALYFEINKWFVAVKTKQGDIDE